MASLTDKLKNTLARWQEERESDRSATTAEELLAVAETIIERKKLKKIPDALAHAYLEATGGPDFLEALDDADARLRWSETSFAFIDACGYTLETMMAHRAQEQADRIYLEEYGPATPARWSYSRIHRRVRTFAASFLSLEGSETRVALFVANSVDGACCDLACLLHDILVTPLNIHFDTHELVWIFDRLKITVAVADSEERLQRLLDVKRKVKEPFTILSLQANRFVEKGKVQLLTDIAARMTPAEVDQWLDERDRFGLHDICTVMFTSGSTGSPKGVAFTQFNLVTKRFARAAVLPSVGRDELLLCYLPLYHTFGRYLELLGMLFWRGTYVFAGNPSAETLIAGMKKVRPTGMISIPLRWMQIRDRAQERMDQVVTFEERQTIFNELTGGRLSWGLSAAGYLEPKAFKFFHTYGVELCSGFGMTEATGGITMSPPSDYLNDTVGIALPGMKIAFSELGEMKISGVYVARYLSEEGEFLDLAETEMLEGEPYLPTGDLFKVLDRGHLTIVDRIKDIYKNNRGQTVAPRRVEMKFQGVPGIKTTFLVGDHRSYNVLLIVTDDEDPVLQGSKDPEERREYFHQIIHTANLDLAPYERVVNFALLDRDFSLDRDELTPKGSFKRKVIEEHFSELIQQLYDRNYVELKFESVKVRLPRWFFRDLGILEDDITISQAGLWDRQRSRFLPLRMDHDEGMLLVGDLEYTIGSDVLDLGLFARQPRLWIGNPSLIEFAPCKEGWDVPMGKVSAYAMLPRGRSQEPLDQASDPDHIGDSRLLSINRLVQCALFFSVEESKRCLNTLSGELIGTDDRLGQLVRRRITALARHDNEDIRSLAYRVLLLDEPMPDYSVAFPAFVQSGLPFLNEESIKAITSTSFEQRRLEALRQRLYSYRRQLSWPATQMVRNQFEGVLRLLVNFVHFHPEYYKPVRAELASWILHREDQDLSAFAEAQLKELVDWFEQRLEEESVQLDSAWLDELLVFDDDLSPDMRKRLKELLVGSTFLRQSVLLAFDEESFDIDQIPSGGIWVSRIQSREAFLNYRVSMNTLTGKHFDLLVILREDVNAEAVRDTNHWMMVIAGNPYGQRVMPRFGCFRPELAAMSLEFVNELTAWDKIREFASVHHPEQHQHDPSEWRKLFVRSMATFFIAWKNSGRRIVPGTVSPINVVVPELDFREGAQILSLTGWEQYRSTFSLFRPLFSSFYRKIAAHYPATIKLLRYEWMFDACVDALGRQEGRSLLERFQEEIQQEEQSPFAEDIIRALDNYLTGMDDRWYVPLALHNAIDRYHDWLTINPLVTSQARAELIEGLISLYRLERYSEIARYYLYRNTYFFDGDQDVVDVFDRLLETLRLNPDRVATSLVELSDLQAALQESEDLDAFSRLVFPQAHRPQPLEVITVGDSEHKQVVVRTHLTDIQGERYDIREPIEPEEVGQIYRLFFQEHFPKTVSELDRYLIVLDSTDRVIAGLCYRMQDREVVHMEGLVTSSPLTGRGIATSLLEDFVTRLASQGIQVLKTGFIMRDFCEKRGFRVDRRWGGLVRFLGQQEV
ncbi:GNAT family N-acetyltransferase [bacterium]|nr:GNAT family N-acetyltransferase [bacterium]